MAPIKEVAPGFGQTTLPGAILTGGQESLTINKTTTPLNSALRCSSPRNGMIAGVKVPDILSAKDPSKLQAENGQ